MLKDADFGMGRQIPDTYRRVICAGDRVLAIRSDRNVTDELRMPAKGCAKLRRFIETP
jgi:hypothetical protein